MPRSRGSPTSTGHTPTFSQISAAARICGGGSVHETQAPPSARSTRCAEQNVWRSASSRPSPRHEVVLSSRAVTRESPGRSSSRASDTSPSSARHERLIDATGYLLETSRRPARLSARAPAPARRASSQETQRSAVGQHLLDRLLATRARVPAHQTWRLTTCRKRTRTSIRTSCASLEQHLRLDRGPVVPRAAGRRRRT